MRNLFLSLLPIFLSQVLFGQITVNFITPENNLVDTSIVHIKARVTPGEYEITSVVATIDNRSVSLINIGPYFQGNLSTSGLPIDSTYVLTVTATDVMGNVGTVSKNVIVDPPPKINIQLPVNYEVATPLLHIKAAANDDSVCKVVVTVDFGYPTYQIAFRDTFINSVDTIISLPDSSYQGLDADVKFRIIDSRNQINESYRKIYVESSPYLERVFSTEGNIEDFNYGKVLSSFETLGIEANKNAKIGNINTGVISEIPAVIYEPSYGPHAYLTPTGAMLIDKDQQMRDWNNGSIYALGRVNSQLSLVVGGSYGIWSGSQPGEYNLFLRNTATLTTKLVSAGASTNPNDVDSNGTVAYLASDGYVYRYSTATDASTRITNSSSYGPLTDGKLIVYTAAGGIYLYANATYIPISNYSGARENEDYRVANGFVAYVKPGTLGQKLIWLRDTAGISTQITFYSTSSTMRGLGDDGSICFYRNIQNSPLYLYDVASNKFKAISSTYYYKTYYRDSAWYVSIGRALFKVNSNFINSYYSVKSGNWSNPATWYGNTVPPTGADVTVGNNVTVDVDATCNTLTVKSNALVTVNTGINLVVLH